MAPLPDPAALGRSEARFRALQALYVDPDVLEPGDVILLSPRALWAKIFRDALETRYTHAELYVGGGTVVDARTVGVMARPILRRRVNRFREFTVLRLSPTGVPDPEARRRILGRAVAYVLAQPRLTRYSMRTVIKALARDRSHLGLVPAEVKALVDEVVDEPDVARGPAGTFCSRLVAAAFEAAGVALARPAAETMPGDLALDPAFVDLHEELGTVWWRARPARLPRR